VHGLGSNCPIRTGPHDILEMAQTWLAAAMKADPKFTSLVEKVETGADPIPTEQNFSSSDKHP
jgi:hypothetical protein